MCTTVWVIVKKNNLLHYQVIYENPFHVLTPLMMMIRYCNYIIISSISAITQTRLNSSIFEPNEKYTCPQPESDQYLAFDRGHHGSGADYVGGYNQIDGLRIEYNALGYCNGDITSAQSCAMDGGFRLI